MKKCIDCDIEKEDSFFWNRKQCSDGLSKFCKACGAIRNKKYHEENKEKIAISNKKYREENKEKINEKQKELYEKQKDERLQYAKIKREQIKENVIQNGLSLPNIDKKKCTHCNETKDIEHFYIRKTKNTYAEMCKVCKKKESSKYRKENRIKINTYRKQYRIDNSKSLVQRNIGINLRKRLSRCINMTGKSTTKLKNELLDCSVEFLKKWFNFNLEMDNMNFDDYGSEWHIDHVITCSAFDLENDKELQFCFHWSNIRPLHKIKNLSKGSKIVWPDIFVHEIRMLKFLELNRIDKCIIQKWIDGALTTAVYGKP